MGNCLPLLFPNLAQNDDDQSPLERAVAESRNSQRRVEQSSYINELWDLETNGERNCAETQAEDIEKVHVSTMLEQIPADIYKEGKTKETECPICMVDFVDGEPIRYLPCMHCYHKECVDDWLMRSFSCPSCMEPVDSAVLSSFVAHTARSLETLVCSPATSSTNQNAPS